jgi:hypothetical protein
MILAVVLVSCESGKATTSAPGQAPRGLPPAEAVPAKAVDNPHAGMPGMDNPHAGMPGMQNPHAEGQAGAANVDPSMVLEGTIDVAPALKAQVKAGDLIFLSVKTRDPQTGEVQRFPLAVDRLDVASLPMPFSLSGANAMMPGTKFAGAVLLVARVDRDAEARTRTAGDIEGTLSATIPAKGMKLVLDTPVKDGAP